MKYRTLGDIALSLAARIVPGILALLAVPFYVDSLGPDSYAAVGFFLTIQMFLGLLDFGLSTTVLREASWLTGQNAPSIRFWILLRTFEIPFWGFACAITAIGLAFGELLLRAVFFIDPRTIGLEFPASALLFASIASRFPFSVYFGYLAGRGYVARANAIVLVLDSIRTIGTVSLLLIVTPSLSLFFGWQTLVSIVTTILAALSARRFSPPTKEPAVVEWALFKEGRNLAVGTGFLTLLFLLANSLDKIFLPRFLTIEDYGFYVAVGQLAAVVFLVAHAIWAAQHPRLLMALSSGEVNRARDVYTFTANMMSGACNAGILVIWLAAPALIRLWIGGTNDTDAFADVLVALTLGYAAAALSHLTLSILQGAKKMAPLLFVLSVAILVIPIAVYFVSGGFTPLSGAIAWSGIYLAFLVGGAASCVQYGRAFAGVWWRTVLFPLLLSIGMALFASRWTHELRDHAQIAAGLGAGILVFAINLAANRQIRDSMKLTISQIFLFRNKTASR